MATSQPFPGSRAIEVDVVVLTWNDAALAERAVQSALCDPRLAVTVYVVDNGSSSAVRLAEHQRVRLHRNTRNAGVSKGRNIGAGLGVAPVLCLLDSDAELRAGSLHRLVSQLLESDDVALVAPVFEGQAPEASGGRAPTLRVKILRALRHSQRYERCSTTIDGDAWDVDFAIGACQVIRRLAFEHVGGLDERYFYGPEDVDFCLRLRLAGWRIQQVAGAPVHHPPRRRNRRVLTVRGAAHVRAVARHLWRHRHFQRSVACLR